DSVQQPGAGVDCERALRLAQHRWHRTLRCIQRRSGGGRLLRLGAPAVALLHCEVHAPIRDELATLSFLAALGMTAKSTCLGIPTVCRTRGGVHRGLVAGESWWRLASTPRVER